MILPAIKSAYVSPARVQRLLDVVQMHRGDPALRGRPPGALPPSLEAITEAPVPDRSRDGEVIRVQGRRLDRDPHCAWRLPAYEHISQYKINYELKLAR